MRNRIFALVVVTVLALGVAWAGGEKGRMDPASKAAKLQAQLGLTDTQTEQVRAVLEDSHKRVAELKASGQEPTAIRGAKKKLKEEREAGLKGIFTAEQFTRYQQIMAEHARKKRGKK